MNAAVSTGKTEIRVPLRRNRNNRAQSFDIIEGYRRVRMDSERVDDHY